MSEFAPSNKIIDVGAPFSQEAEEATIASCFIDPSVFVSLRAFLKPGDFFLMRHNIIWQAMCDLDDNDTPLDMVTIAERLDNMGKLDELGGYAYLVKLSNSMGTSYHAEIYGQLVERTRIRRELMMVSDEIKVLAQDELGTVQEVLNYAQSKLLDIRIGGDDSSLDGLQDAISEHIDTVEWRSQNPNAMIGIPTGFKLLDHITRGLQDSRLYMIGARPGMGKSAFMGNLAINAAKQGKRVAWFSYEMTRHELITRWTSQLSNVPNDVIESGMLDSNQRKRYLEAAGELGKMPIAVTDKNVTPMMIRAMCRKMKHTRGLDAVFIDYVQLIPPDNLKANRYQDVGAISKALKDMAMELSIPIVTAAQLSRAVEQRSDNRPKLSHLRESGNLEQDSDVVMFIHSDYYYNDDLKSEDFWQSEVIVSKQRNGGAGVVKVGFNRPTTHFADMQVNTFDTGDFE